MEVESATAPIVRQSEPHNGVKMFEPPAEKQKFRRTYEIDDPNFQPAILEELAIAQKRVVNVTIPPLKRRPKRLATSPNGYTAYLHGKTCRVAYRDPVTSKIISKRLEGHTENVTDFQWSPMQAETGLSMLCTTGVDGKVICNYLTIEKDVEGKTAGFKVLDKQEFTVPGFIPGTEDYYSKMKISGNPYNGFIALSKTGSGAIRIVNYKFSPKFAEFEGGLPPEPLVYDDLEDDIFDDDEDEEFIDGLPETTEYTYEEGLTIATVLSQPSAVETVDVGTDASSMLTREGTLETDAQPLTTPTLAAPDVETEVPEVNSGDATGVAAEAVDSTVEGAADAAIETGEALEAEASAAARTIDSAVADSTAETTAAVDETADGAGAAIVAAAVGGTAAGAAVAAGMMGGDDETPEDSQLEGQLDAAEANVKSAEVDVLETGIAAAVAADAEKELAAAGDQMPVDGVDVAGPVIEGTDVPTETITETEDILKVSEDGPEDRVDGAGEGANDFTTAAREDSANTSSILNLASRFDSGKIHEDAAAEIESGYKSTTVVAEVDARQNSELRNISEKFDTGAIHEETAAKIEAEHKALEELDDRQNSQLRNISEKFDTGAIHEETAAKIEADHKALEELDDRQNSQLRSISAKFDTGAIHEETAAKIESDHRVADEIAWSGFDERKPSTELSQVSARFEDSGSSPVAPEAVVSGLSRGSSKTRSETGSLVQPTMQRSLSKSGSVGQPTSEKSLSQSGRTAPEVASQTDSLTRDASQNIGSEAEALIRESSQNTASEAEAMIRAASGKTSSDAGVPSSKSIGTQ